MKKYRWLIWIIVLILAGGAIWYWRFREEEKVIVLETEKPQYGTLSTSVTATGTVQPVDTVAVGTQVSGTIKSVYADFNSTVKKGQLLAQLDKSLLLATLQQATANLQQAKANLVYQESNYQRQSKLYNVGAISKADSETALYQYNIAKDNVSSAEAQLNSAEKNLSYADIYSPIDGTVLSRSISEGQTVASSFSTPTLFSIAKDLTKMQVQASVDEADIGNVTKGQRVIFTVDAFPADTFAGSVKEIRLKPSTSANVVMYTTIIDAPNALMKLKPGMTASIVIYTKEIKDALIIPAKALSFQPDSILMKKYTVQGGPPGSTGGGRKHKKGFDTVPPGPGMDGPENDSVTKTFIWVKKDSSLMMRPITIGMNDETQVQVESGLETTDEMVTGYRQLQKEQVKAKKTESSPFMPKRPGGNNKKSNPGPPPQ